MSDKPRRRRPARPTGAASATAAGGANGTTGAASATTERSAAAEGEAPAGRLIRKYGNRRLYDTFSSRYVTLEDLVEVFAAEGEVRVVDAVTGDDLTKKVLAQAILFEEDRRRTQIIPLELLRSLLRHRDQASGEVWQRRIAKTLSELPRTKGGKAAVATPAADEKSDEIDELRRRLKALEKQIQRR